MNSSSVLSPWGQSRGDVPLCQMKEGRQRQRKGAPRGLTSRETLRNCNRVLFLFVYLFLTDVSLGFNPHTLKNILFLEGKEKKILTTCYRSEIVSKPERTGRLGKTFQGVWRGGLH